MTYPQIYIGTTQLITLSLADFYYGHLWYIQNVDNGDLLATNNAPNDYSLSLTTLPSQYLLFIPNTASPQNVVIEFNQTPTSGAFYNLFTLAPAPYPPAPPETYIRPEPIQFRYRRPVVQR